MLFDCIFIMRQENFSKMCIKAYFIIGRLEQTKLHAQGLLILSLFCSYDTKYR